MVEGWDMESDVTQNFSVEISAVEHFSEHGRHLVNDTFETQLAVNFRFLVTRAWEDYHDWETVADARLGHFYDAEFAVTPYDPRSGQELRFPSWRGTRGYGVGGHGRRYEPVDGTVFYTSTDQYSVLAADLKQFLHAGTDGMFKGQTLDLQGRPVIDFLIDRLQTSRLIPDGMLDRLGLKGTPPVG